MNWEIAVSILSGIATAIPLVVGLVRYVRAAVKEKNWAKLLNLVMGLMAEAETKFAEGADRKEWVLAMVRASADTINYDVDYEEVGELIDALCCLTKAVNVEAADEKAGGKVK